MDVESDLPLVIPLSAISDYFQCSICMCNLTQSVLTQCGHRYCEKCITEWVNRQHKCPCCNAVLNAGQLYKDHQFDNLLSTIEGEKEKSETRYFEGLINAVADNKERKMSPMENVLKEHLKKGLLEHERYFQSLKHSFQSKVKLLDHTTERSIQELQTHELTAQEVTLQTQDLHNTLERQKQELNMELEKCAQMVADTYDKYLTSHIPNLDVLPVKVSITISGKNITIPDVVFQPSDCIKDVRVAVESAMIKRHNPLHTWGNDVKMFLFGPFAKCSECEMESIMRDFVTTGFTIPDVQLLTEGCLLGLQYGMKPGSNIVIYGSVKLESDLPKKCFVETFDKDNNQKVDYFSCTDCAFKWICRSCMEVCHQGHSVIPYIMQHQPAWACCYCPKKKKCKIQTTG